MHAANLYLAFRAMADHKDRHSDGCPKHKHKHPLHPPTYPKTLAGGPTMQCWGGGTCPMLTQLSHMQSGCAKHPGGINTVQKGCRHCASRVQHPPLLRAARPSVPRQWFEAQGRGPAVQPDSTACNAAEESVHTRVHPAALHSERQCGVRGGRCTACGSQPEGRWQASPGHPGSPPTCMTHA
jgi:hypothetical protein